MSEQHRRAVSMRRLLAILLGALGLLLAALIVVASQQVSGTAAQTRAANLRATSYQVADSLRQSSDQLTNMVRLYVATGDRRYGAYYRQILRIRGGTSPRPRNYTPEFWDRVLTEGTGFVRYGPPESLTAQMRAARFRPDEFRALETALATSNQLANLENDVMAEVARRIRRGVDAAYAADVAPLYRRLVDHAYLVEKGRIMSGVGRFAGLVQARTLRGVRRAQSHNDRLLKIEIAILVVIALVGLAAMVLLSRVVLRPLGMLAGATRRIAAGEYGERVDLRAVSELERVAGAFNAMAGAVQSDIGRREAAERDAVAARQVAEHANRAKSTFLAAMSHEIRTPMIGVTGMLEVLARTDLAPSQREMVETADGSAAALLQIIGDILDFSKIEADRLELAPETFSLRDVAGAAVDTFVHTASAKGLLLTLSTDDALAPAHVGDPLRLRQIVSNLISNAVKFTRTGGIEARVCVTGATATAQTVEITVRDTGIGIEPSQQERLFEEFVQADGSTPHHHGGTGLGLVICRRLARLMGGDITLVSASGHGTTARLELPLALGDAADLPSDAGPGRGHGPAAIPRARTREDAEREGSLVLLAEDHPVNRVVLCHQLEAIGFHIDAAADGEEAFARWRSTRYVALLTDLNMPRLDGYELARRIRASDADRRPIIALSANVMQGEPERCREAGMDDFAAKPTTIPALATRLRHVLPGLDWTAGTAGTGGSLNDLTGGDPELAAALMDDFRAVTQDDLAVLSAALAAHDRDTVSRQAHRIKGAARIVGETALAGAAERIEAAARDGGWDDLQAEAERLAAALG